ncbi:MAG: ABC transporter ATP-binding protein/permease [Eubacterium sp.]|nr:ABC transporter ATP-binding protein/permease [Eubacterium sp.]
MPTGGMTPEAPPLNKRSSKETRALINRIYKYAIKWKKVCIVLILMILLTIVCQLAVPILVEHAINCLMFRDAPTFTTDISRILISLVLLFVFNSIIEYIKNISAMKLSENMSLEIRDSLFDKVLHAPLSYLDKHSYGDIMSRLTNDSQRVSTVAQVLEEFVSKIVLIVGCGIIMMMESWKLAVISMVTAVVTMLISAFISGHMRNYFMKQTIALGAMNGHIEESMKNFRTMEMAGIGAFNGNKMREKSEKYTDVCIKSSMFSAIINPIMLILGNLSFLITVVVGGHLVIEKAILLGTLQAIIMYSKTFMDSVYGFGNVMIQTQSFLASAERVFEILDIEPENEGTHSRLVKQGQTDELSEEDEVNLSSGVTYKNISFAYEEDQEVIHCLDLSFEKGKLTALVGSTGSGKTTLVSLLLKFYDNYRGDIYIGNKNTKDMTLLETRSAVTVVLQDSKLIDGTIIDNITYGLDASLDSEKIARETIKNMGVEELIEKLPEGLNTVTSDDDETISMGMRQMIGLARALVRKPGIIIMDEALSAVDSETENKIRKNVIKMLKDVTVLVIAHRLDTIMDADKIVVLSEGKVIEEGTSDKLLESKGEFYRLCNRQLSGDTI